MEFFHEPGDTRPEIPGEEGPVSLQCAMVTDLENKGTMSYFLCAKVTSADLYGTCGL